jgi:hypothetical protein
MSKHQRRSLEHTFRCKVWFGFFLLCAAVFFFPPWLVSSSESYPKPFRSYWLTHGNFHFLTYQPPDEIWHVMDKTGYCSGMAVRTHKHLNYSLLGVELAGLGLLASVLHFVIRKRTIRG